MTAASDVLASNGTIKGQLDVEAWNRKLTGVNIGAGGTWSQKVNLSPRSAGNVTVRVDLASRKTLLWKGDLIGDSASTGSGDINVDVARFASTDMSPKSIAVSAANGALQLTLGALTGSVISATLPGAQLAWQVGSTNAKISQLSGTATQEDTRINLQTASLRDASFGSTDLILATQAGGAKLFRGSGVLALNKLSAAERDVSSAWSVVATDSLSTFLPGGLSSMKWSERGATNKLRVDANLIASRLSVGAVEVERSIELLLTNGE